ncbi:SulP family inorganic anion transporter [Alkalihalophilus lindianensis]|uniref:SulP family inorganic anion transporter n=1 Tax=Alkalihalophilus lindianensis TaxID=1630542 RepID=A0ABU3X988_9BACI|nr:SulP family inorganic anion transporter [Alkalihalophilus lindianensis]MDV2684456.1 SulP family inorganic anion transporter [Alkalihalophilus lindianensis]
MFREMIPLANQLSTYQKNDLMKDLYAAIMVSSLLVPQSMAYAILAGLPAVYGFYTAIFPLLIYGIFGASRQLSVGPVAVLSIMVFSTISVIAPIGSPLYLQLIFMTTLLVGLLQMILSVCRAGSLIRFIPPQVMSGFTIALALTIILNQLQYIGNVPFNKELPFLLASIDLIRSINSIDLATVLFSFFLFIIYFITRHTNSKLPATIWIIVIGLLVTYLLSFDTKGLVVVGDIPNTLPPYTLPSVLVEYLPIILPLAGMLALIGYMESVAMINHLNRKKHEKIKPNQELFTLGLANTVGSCLCCLPVAGAFSRSAVNADAGAKSGLASLFTAAFLLIILLFFTKVFAYLPMAALAIIIIVAAVRLIDVNILRGRGMSRGGYRLFGITLISCVAFGLIEGFLTGVILAWVFREGK